jgi:hypothetical protein
MRILTDIGKFPSAEGFHPPPKTAPYLNLSKSSYRSHLGLGPYLPFGRNNM